jgi:hypothetical protein
MHKKPELTFQGPLKILWTATYLGRDRILFGGTTTFCAQAIYAVTLMQLACAHSL